MRNRQRPARGTCPARARGFSPLARRVSYALSAAENEYPNAQCGGCGNMRSAKNGFDFLRPQKAVPTARRARKKWDLNGRRQIEISPHRGSSSLRAIQRDIKENPSKIPATLLKLPPLKTPATKTNRAGFSASGNRKKSEKVIDKIPPQWKTENFKIGDYCSVAQR